MKKLTLIVILILMYNCGTYKETTLTKIEEGVYITTENDTLTAGKGMSYAIDGGCIKGVVVKEGKIKNGRWERDCEN